MLDFESTPIFQYDGPPERRKQLESLGRVFLGMVKGAMGGDLPFAKHAMKLPDGTIISATSIRSSGVVDIIRVHVPQQVTGEEEEKKGKKGVHLETVVESVEQIVPVLVEAPDTTDPSYSLCSWSSPKFSGFQYFFKEPPYPMYALIQPGSREITLREFKSYNNSGSGISTTDTPGDLVVDGEGSEGDPQTGSSSGTGTTDHEIVTPDGDVLKSATYSVSNNVSWSQYKGGTENPGLMALYINISEHIVSASGYQLRGLGSSYVPDTGDFACIYIQSEITGYYYDTAVHTVNPWYPGVEGEPDYLSEEEILSYDFGANLNCTYSETNNLRLLIRKNGIISDISLPPEWDYDSEWEVSKGNVVIYKEKAVVYSYLKTEKGIAE